MMSFTEEEFRKKITRARLQGIAPMAFIFGTAFLIITRSPWGTDPIVVQGAGMVGFMLAILGLVGMLMLYGAA